MKKILSLILASAMLSTGLAAAVSAETISSRVEAEWCENTNIPYNEEGENGLPVYRSSTAFSNGLAVNHTNTSELPSSGWYMSYDIVVNADGIYNLSFLTSAVGSRYTSEYSVALNDNEPIQIASGMKVGDGANANWAKYQLNVYLEKGRNTIKFIVADYTENSKGGSSPRCVFYFDYFDVTFAESQGIIAEGESYFSPSTSGIGAVTDTADSAISGDKRYLKFSGAASGEDDTKSAKLKVYAPKSGSYTMNTICTKIGVGWTGLWDLSDEYGNTYPMNAQTVSFIRDVIPSASNAFSEYNLNTPVQLQAGDNIFTITVHPRSTGDFTTFIDYIAFTESSASQMTIEAESCEEPGYWSASNGRLTLKQTDEVWGYDPVGDAFEVYFDFDAEAEGDYHFYFDMAAANASNNNVSRLEMSLDGERWTSFDTSNLKYYGKTSSGISPGNGPAVYRYEKGYSLTAGGHRLGLRVTEPIAPDDRRLEYFADIDKIMVLPDNRSAESAQAEISAPYLSVGEDAEVTLKIYDNYGNLLNNDEFEISYESSDEGVIKVGSDGMITAVSCGSADIIVNAHSELLGDVSASVGATAISDVQGIYVTGCERTGSKVSVKLINPKHTSNKVTLFVTEYEMVNGAEKLTAVHAVDLSQTIGKVGENELRGIMEKTYEVELEKADSISDVYFWSDGEEMITLWNGVIGQEG